MPEVEPNDPSWDQAWDQETASKESPAPLPDVQAAPVVVPDQAQEPQEEPNPVLDAVREQGQAFKQYADSVQQSVGGLAAELRQVNAEAAVARQTPGGPSQEAIDQAQKDPESWAKLKEDWSEWAGPIEEFFNHKMQAALKAAASVDEDAIAERVAARLDKRRQEERQKEQDAEQQARQELEGKFQSERAKVLRVIPTFDEVRKSDDFLAWAKAQPAEVQALANSTDAVDAIDMMLRYEKRPSQRTAVTVQQERQQRLARSAVPGRTVTPGPKQPINTENMTWDQAWEHHNELKARAQAGA